MDEAGPRRLFGLLCAHHWEYVADRHRKWASGRTESRPVSRCKHCGAMKIGYVND